jgi:hypothetical protein
MATRQLLLALGLGIALPGCFQNHSALVKTQALPPPPEPTVRHSSRLWLALERVGPSQCVTPEGRRAVCFEDVDRALADALGRALWTSFPGIAPLGRGDAPAPSDYVLTLEIELDTVAPSAAGGPGWAALARANWRLERGGVLLASERVESVSRADFGYGGPLGSAAGEVVDAIAVHIGTVLGALPETQPQTPRPLPPVTAEVGERNDPPKLAEK